MPPRKMPRWKAVFRAWPPVGALFVIASFLVTACWLLFALRQPEELNWLEPLAAFLAGMGAFIVAAILIFRRVDDARAEASVYGLARGLATGYYFNFVRPLLLAISDPEHPLHTLAANAGGHKIAGLVIGLPQTAEYFDPNQHQRFLEKTLGEGPSPRFNLKSVEIPIAGRPRPLHATLALSDTTAVALIVDIPTTLTVISDFASFFAERELGAAATADDAVIKAREEIVAEAQTEQFADHLAEFVSVINKVPALEATKLSPAALPHLVPLKRLRRRMSELADH
jgi:hypothetical protein